MFNLVRLSVSRTPLTRNAMFCSAPRLSSADLDQSRRRILYHSKQRGWLELDLIFGTFADQRLATLSEADLIDYKKVLIEENPDLFKWMSGQVPPPDHLKDLPVVKQLMAHINENHPSTFLNR